MKKSTRRIIYVIAVALGLLIAFGLFNAKVAAEKTKEEAAADAVCKSFGYQMSAGIEHVDGKARAQCVRLEVYKADLAI